MVLFSEPTNIPVWLAGGRRWYRQNRYPLRPHQGAPHGGPSPRQFVGAVFSFTRPGAGKPMSWSSSLLSHWGHITA